MYKYKEALALNNLQWLICHKSQLTNNKATGVQTHSFLCHNPTL